MNNIFNDFLGRNKIQIRDRKWILKQKHSFVKLFREGIINLVLHYFAKIYQLLHLYSDQLTIA